MIGEKDMGPFAGMDLREEMALVRYGTPPVRLNVTVTVRDIGHYAFDDMPTTFEAWVEWLEAARREVPEQYQDSLRFVLEWEPGYYDSGDSAGFTVKYIRPETDAEMVTRVSQGINSIRRNDAEQRRTYETLKKKFERDS
jgi:hypothetical protein